MKRFALLDSSGELTRFGLEAKGRMETTLIASPLETHAYVIDLPPLKKGMIAGALRFKLRALHPGNPDKARIDYHPNGGKPQSFIAFVSETSVMARYLASGLPVAAPVSVLSVFAGKRGGASIAFFWTNRWIEAVRFEDRGIASIEAVPVEGDHETAFLRLRSSFPGGMPLESVPSMAIRSSGIGPEASSIERLLAGAGATAPALIDIDTVPLPARKNIFGLYERKEKKSLSLLAAAALVLLAANFCAVPWTIDRIADMRSKESALRKTIYERKEKRFASVESKRKELQELEREYAGYRAKRPVDAYGVLSEVCGRLGPDSWVKSLVLRKDAFSLEAEGVDAVQAFADLERSPLLRNIKLHQAQPSAIRGESFSLSGTIRDDR